MTAATEYETYLGGRWVWPDGAAATDIHDPASWDVVIARVPELGPDDVPVALRSAAEGADEWARTNAIDRGNVLLRAAGLLRQRAADLATVLSRENGKTQAEASVEVAKTADFFEYYGAMARQPSGELLPDARAGVETIVRREPLGVVLAITPWNDPLLTPARKLAPALACGNAVVLKPAADTPVIALELVRLLLEAGVAPRALSVMPGSNSDFLHALVSAPEIDAVTFTGSTAVGLGLQRRLAGRNVRLQTEMGGKNAAVVLADADLSLAAEVVTAAAFAQAGQRCTATSRVLVEQPVSDELLDRLCSRAAALVLGAGTAPETTMGPLVNPSRVQQVLAAIDGARGDGARVVAGGGRAAAPLDAGCFVEPTVLADVRESMAVWREEVFGPVLAVLVVSGLDQAVGLTNDSPYGLSSSLFTRDLAAAQRFVREVRTGQVAVNLPTSGWDVHHPFGGWGLSGSAFKEQGREGLQFYCRTKTCAVVGF